jgi:RNA polymerase-binding transcription factor DksA
MAKKKAAKKTKKASAKKAAGKSPAKKASAKKAAKKSPAKKASAKKAAKKSPAKKASAKKAAKKSPAKKAATKKASKMKAAKKAKPVKKATAKKAVSKKSTPKKQSKKTGTTKKVKKAKKVVKNRLTKAAMEPYKKQLLDRKADLVRQVLVQNEDMDELRDDQPADPLDMAMNTSSLEMMTALGNNERIELSEIDEALIKIEAGTFGMCEVCLVEPLKLCNTCPNIPIPRLEAIPTARYCVQVKEQQERTPGAYADRPRRRALLGDDMVVSGDDE